MKIGNKEYSEIIVTDKEDGVLAVITDEDIIEENSCKVVCTPEEKDKRTLQDIDQLIAELSNHITEMIKNGKYEEKEIADNAKALAEVLTARAFYN